MSTHTTKPVRMDARQRVILLAILIAIFAIPTSISGTAVALPAIAVQLGADFVPLQWAVTAFNLTFACFTLAWGASADLFGRKRIFVLGALIYTLAACGSAMATDIVQLDIARAIAGVGAAAIFAAGSAILATEFDDAGRLRAFALAGAAVGVGVGVGPIVSGFLVDNLGWRSIVIPLINSLF